MKNFQDFEANRNEFRRTTNCWKCSHTVLPLRPNPTDSSDAARQLSNPTWVQFRRPPVLLNITLQPRRSASAYGRPAGLRPRGATHWRNVDAYEFKLKKVMINHTRSALITPLSTVPLSSLCQASLQVPVWSISTSYFFNKLWLKSWVLYSPTKDRHGGIFTPVSTFRCVICKLRCKMCRHEDVGAL